jgi:hypothetical protein
VIYLKLFQINLDLEKFDLNFKEIYLGIFKNTIE